MPLTCCGVDDGLTPTSTAIEQRLVQLRMNKFFLHLRSAHRALRMSERTHHAVPAYASIIHN
eukprot:m.418718 g.418718  ORF g.418718 m.418718 type:complete len:62 (+) comp21294_c0_seq3:1288-1473(+)